MLATPAQLFQAVVGWPARSQDAARRNALVACTALAERRREREEVEAYLLRFHPRLVDEGPAAAAVGPG